MNVVDYFFETSGGLSKEAVVGRESITYTDLFTQVNKTAAQLQQQFGEENLILLLSENSVFCIVAYLAIIKSGNICIPLNPAIETENLDKVLLKTKSTLAFASKRYEKRFTDYDFTVFNNDTIHTWGLENEMEMEASENFDEQRLAEIIFTSGSTGDQKGVMITHRNIIANTNSIIAYLHLTQEDIIEVVMPFYYCYGLSLLHTHLKVGGAVHMNNSFIFVGGVIDDLNRYKCTGFAGVPSHFQILLRKTRDFKHTRFETLRYVTQAGGKLHNAFISEFTETFPDIKFYVMYGQTEATARLSYLPPEDLAHRLGSLGKGIPDVQLKVVNNQGEPVKPGETGEIIAKGENVMKGYFQDERGTRETIRDGWLYTGDMATVDEDGYIYMQSRAKEIIKVRGIRISPKEIEAVIVNYPGVIDCSIVSETDDITGEALKAIVYVNESDLDQFSEEAIRQYCATKLSAAKVPAKVVFDTRLAFNAAGKKSKF
ncbi:MAG: AMP-binding protein [Lentimicrobium sp.]|jgi:acyl-CoA synthetase (AMP-forming)/AMP-acid ligase II|nr:AMP-binding protein [Lentimicrobium sp.]MDD2527281.1 AMP-binding protein [Lentimicrobiaceae bacterium]MDY0026742.1 AMP-binding protein [Lentimicrobium sp.]